MQPIISIVTPSYNQGHFIGETLDSLLSQDYPQLEIWVIDGGSDDETLTVLQSYADPRLNWISEPDNGQSDALNKGIARCTGEIFSWLNSDDLLLPGALHQVADCWMAAQQPSLIYGRARIINADGADLGLAPLQSASATATQLLRRQAQLMQPATFMPLAALRELGGVDQTLDYAMDLDLWVKLGQRLPLVHIPADLAVYRLHDTSKTMAQAEKFLGDYEIILERAVAAKLIDKKQAMVDAQMFAANIHLSPYVRQYRQALPHLARAVRQQPRILPKALSTLGKGVASGLLSASLWAKVRALRPKIS